MGRPSYTASHPRWLASEVLGARRQASVWVYACVGRRGVAGGCKCNSGRHSVRPTSGAWPAMCKASRPRMC
jgi:hypothetical protein